MKKLTLDLFASSTLIKAAAAANHAVTTRVKSNSILNRLNNLVDADQLSPSDREQCSSRVGAAMVVYGH